MGGKGFRTRSFDRRGVEEQGRAIDQLPKKQQDGIEQQARGVHKLATSNTRGLGEGG